MTGIVAILLYSFAAVLPAYAFDDAALARRAYDKIILPGYAGFDAAAQKLATQAGGLCDKPAPAALAATREAVKGAIVAWGRIEALRFGPITQNKRLDRLLFYPDANGIVGKQTSKLLATKDAADIEPEKLAGASVAVQGFGALDVALFGRGSDALATPDEDARFRCRYIRALSLDIAQIAGETHSAWKGDFGALWLSAGPGNATFLSAGETTQALYRAFVTQIDVLRLQRLSALNGGNSKPTGPLFMHSGLGLAFIVAGIEGERELISDDAFADAALAGTDKERTAIEMLGSVATDLGFAVRAGEAAMGMAADPLRDPQAQARLTPMLLSLKNAEEIGRAALGELTGQALGFNSLDGD